MLSAALKFRKAFERMAEEDKLFADHFEEEDNVTKIKRVGPPSIEEWENAEQMVKFLKTFYDTTLLFSASKKVTSSGCYNEICKISNSLKVMVANPDEKWSDMVEKFDKYWEGLEKINKILIVACVLDPRRKMGFVMHCFEKIYEKGNLKCCEISDGVLNLLKRLFVVYQAEYKLTSGAASGSKEVNLDGLEDEMDLGGCDEEDDPFGEWGKMSGGSEDLKETKNELDIYLLDKIEPHVRNPLGFEWDILDWWKTNSSRYPVLACMARNILAIHVSTVASESAFSTGGRILDQYRSSLTHKTVEALILTQDWLRSSLCYVGTNIFRQLKEENDILHAVTEEMQNVAAAASASGSF